MNDAIIIGGEVYYLVEDLENEVDCVKCELPAAICHNTGVPICIHLHNASLNCYYKKQTTKETECYNCTYMLYNTCYNSKQGCAHPNKMMELQKSLP